MHRTWHGVSLNCGEGWTPVSAERLPTASPGPNMSLGPPEPWASPHTCLRARQGGAGLGEQRAGMDHWPIHWAAPCVCFCTTTWRENCFLPFTALRVKLDLSPAQVVQVGFVCIPMPECDLGHPVLWSFPGGSPASMGTCRGCCFPTPDATRTSLLLCFCFCLPNVFSAILKN